MLSRGDTKLEKFIIRFLSKQGFLSVEDLHKKLNKFGIDVSIQGIYRVLRKLQSEGVIIKENQKISLRISWIFELKRHVENMESTYLNAVYLESFIPKNDRGKYVWQFTKFLKLANFWDQLLIAVATISKGKISCHYSPYPWFNIADPAHTTIFNKTYASVIKKEYIIFGGRTFLHKYEPGDLVSLDYEDKYYAIPEEYIEKDRRIYIDVIGDYVLTIKVDAKTTERLENLYKNLTSEKDILNNSLVEFFDKKISTKVTVEKNGKKAKKYRTRFEKIFGPIHYNKF